DQKVDVHAIQLKVGYTNANLNKSHYAEMKKGDTDILFSSPSNDFEAEGYVSMVEGDTFDTVDIYHGTSSEVIFDLERANILDLNWRQIVILSFALPIVLLALVVFLVVMAAGKHNISVKKKRGILDEYATYNAKPAAAICAAVVLFLLQELLYWLMPGYMLQRALLKLLIGLILIYLCYVGYRRQPTTLSRHLIYGLTVCIIADIFINFSFEAGIITYALGEIFFIYAFTRYDRLERWQWIFWVLSSVFCIAVIHFSNLSAASEKQFSIYAVILMALVATALTMPKRIRHGAILLVISNVLLFRNEVMPKTLLSHVFALSIYYLAMGFFAFSSRYKELRALSLWKEDAPARQKLMSYMKSVTDRNSEDYIPIENRIAVFDLDGTLFCETDPNYFDYTLLVHRVLEDPDYIDKASDFEKEVANKIVTLNKTGVAASGLEVDHGRAIASAFAGMTIGEFNAYIQKFKQLPMPSYEGLKRGDGWYKPMLQLIEYLQENAFTVYVVSGTDRLIVRGIIYKSDLNVPARQIIGSDESIVTKKQGEADGLNYVFDDADELVLGGEFLVKNLKMNKVTVIAQEIGTQPVLSFGNSTGDSSMAEYVHNNNPYKSMAFMLCCDDTERENGNKEKADKMYALCKQFGWTPVSMKKDWVTIYGNNVKHKKK
ncbi:MAG: haloacid dehalogenase-like hydrolase, partial [Erysipelotrichaceae bacterium]|nr:haloacid dehalogenase-like hydrolase [Erysipelotrichaceae bacterium]